MSEQTAAVAADDADLAAADAVLSATPLVDEAVLVPLPRGGRPWLVARADEEQLREGRFVNVREAIRFRLETSALALPVGHRHCGLTIARRPIPRREDGSPDRRALAEAIGDPPRLVWPEAPPRRTPAPAAWDAALRAMPVLGGRERPLALEDSLELDLGLDSLERMELIVGAARAAGANAADDAVTRIYTVGDLIRELAPGLPDAGRAAATGPDDVLRPPPGEAAPRAWLRAGGLPWPIVRLSRLVGRPLARRLLGLRADGVADVDWSERPLLIACNHQSHMDAVLLAACLPPAVHRQVLFLGFTGYFARGFGKLVGRIYRIFPISADESALRGLRVGVAAVDAGRILCIYPEGERTWDGSLRPFRRGVAWIARETGARVVPACIAGAYQAWPRGRGFVRHPVSLRFGRPIEPPPPGSGVEDEDRFLARLRAEIGALLSASGCDPERGDPEVWARGPDAALARRAAAEVGSGE